MRTQLYEGIVLGVAIGLAAFAIRAWADGAAFWQGLLLLLTGLVLTAVQLWFSFRRARASEPSSAASARAHRYANNPFAQELTRNWTGLNDQAIEPSSSAAPNPTEPDEPSTVRTNTPL